MDMFILKSYYGYVNRHNITSNDKELKAPPAAIIAKIQGK